MKDSKKRLIERQIKTRTCLNGMRSTPTTTKTYLRFILQNQLAIMNSLTDDGVKDDEIKTEVGT